VLFLDSDDFYEDGAGQVILSEIGQSNIHPIIFFRCRTESGLLVGRSLDENLIIDLHRYLHHSSYGEALTAVNKKIIGSFQPYITDLRGYEGLGCARLIKRFGPALLSAKIVRVYVISPIDRLSSGKGFLSRMPLIASGHLYLIREFWRELNVFQLIFLVIKSAIYYIVGNCYLIFSKS
jgi:hypothetical protein